MRISFTKMHGCGNDYIYLDCRQTGLPEQVADWSVKLSPRHTAVGADGIICICPPQTSGADATMRIFNADGSEGRMCGNGVRCVAEYLYTHGMAKDPLEIDTLSGRKTLHRLGEGRWQAEMGQFSAMAADLPAVEVGEGPLVHMTVEAAGRSWDAAGVSMGNPHCVIQWPDEETLPTGMELAAMGPAFEKNKLFPEGINTEFVYVRDATHLKMRVWERGSGETMACGTGACASAVAMVLRGISPRDVPIEIELLGGKLEITVCSDDHVLMSGPTATAFTGEAEVD